MYTLKLNPIDVDFKSSSSDIFYGLQVLCAAGHKVTIDLAAGGPDHHVFTENFVNEKTLQEMESLGWIWFYEQGNSKNRGTVRYFLFTWLEIVRSKETSRQVNITIKL